MSTDIQPTTLLTITYLILVICLLSTRQVSSLNLVNCYFGSPMCTSGDVFNETNPNIVQITWRRNKGQTDTADTGPDTDQNTGTAEGYYMYIETSTPRVVNDKARLYTSTLDSGRYTVEFWYIARGANLGGLSVYTREDGSPYAKLIWYYSYNINSTVDNWTIANVEVNRESSFRVEFDGWRGTTGLGDIAIDSIRISRDGDAAPAPTPAVANVPFRCTFEDGNCGFQIVDFRNQFSWVNNFGDRTTTGTGPNADHTLNSFQGNWMLVDMSNAPTPKTGMRAVLRSPTFWTSSRCLLLDFYYCAYGSDLNKLEVWVDGYDTPIAVLPEMREGKPVSKDEWINWNGTVWITEPTQLLFIGYSSNTVHGDVAIDDVAIAHCQITTITTPDTTTSTAMASTTTNTTTSTAMASTTTNTTTSTEMASTSTNTTSSTSTTSTTISSTRVAPITAGIEKARSSASPTRIVISIGYLLVISIAIC